MEDQVGLEVVYMRQISFSMQQNYVPVIKAVKITNNMSTALTDLKADISLEPEYASKLTIKAAAAAPGETVEITPVHMVMSPDKLLSLTERMAGNIHIDVFSGDNALISRDYPIDIYAYDEWTGTLVMPELICAFVTPNAREIAKIAGNAGMYLNKWRNDPSFTGYQTQNPNVVKLQMAAVYAALQEQNIAYQEPPASFDIGQKIRLPHEVLENKGGTCLDLSLLYISVLEYIGLHPLVILIKGHAFAGCWLEEQTFPECVQDDASAITKRTADGVNELCLVECTAFTAGKNIDFDHASGLADSALHDNETFEMAIDIKRCRNSGYHPIPASGEAAAVKGNIDYGERNDTEITDRPDEIDISRKVSVEYGKTELTRQALWERKLLDLSMRNPLLNFRPSRSNIQLMAANLDQIEDELSDGSEFQIAQVPEDWKNGLYDEKIFEIETQKDLINTLATNEFKSKRIRTFVSEAELSSTMKYLQRQAKQSLEENGANTMYLALGFLKWYESDISEKPRFAPIILIPVDIIKKVTSKAYTIRVRDEDTQMNITLLELLRQDFGLSIGGLDPLPGDDHGVNIPAVFSIIRQAVMGKSRWDLKEYSFLGLFSFSQFIMWNDIRNRAEDLKTNKVVRSLISGKMEWQPESDTLTEETLDDLIKPADIAVPTSTDSSQLLAICEASKGQSFVLHGPPGTGKSQTITNLIANALYNGKSVLFVAEKMAALSVVQKRLAKIGLDPFCLELHSNKAQKKEVLSQLEKTLDVGRIKEPGEYAGAAAELYRERTELNRVMKAVHVIRSPGISFYDAVARYESVKISDKAEDNPLRFSTDCIKNMQPDTIAKWKEDVDRLAIAGKEAGGFRGNVYEHYGNTSYSREQQDAFIKDIDRYEGLINTLHSLFVSLTGKGQTLFAEYNKLQSYFNAYVSCSAMAQALTQEFSPAVLDYNATDARQRWNAAQAKWFLPKMTESKNIIKELAILANAPKNINAANITGFYDKIDQYRTAAEQLKPQAAQFSMISMQAVSLQVKQYMDAFNQCSLMYTKFRTDYKVSAETVYAKISWYEDMLAMLEGWKNHTGELRDWSALMQLLDKADGDGLSDLTGLYKSGMISEDRLSGFMQEALYRDMAETWIDSDPALNSFQGVQFEETIRRYSARLKEFEELTIKELVAKLSASIPVSSGSVADSSEIGILLKAIRSSGRGLSIRKLFDQIPKLLRRICPCMLMSPMSVAQYIDPSYPKFDLVVFDEASQMPTCEAVGAIARGENVVVVGDPKQMPPTSFFAINRVDEDNFSQEDLESVLDDCLALNMPQHHLLWHYRSRHESLISYSNAKYYDNKLYTFPSPNDLISEVKWVHTGGVYDKSGTRQNRAEAEAIVADVIKRVKEEDDPSIGVVTFSVQQQELVDDIMSDAQSQDPELAARMDKLSEPVFIKNLENVQGDERDVILFSVGYGPDKDGKVSMNFGPLNQAGGWRRLNVAITRSRKEMVVYSTITPDQIDLSRTNSEGVAGLKGFIEFAARGKNELPVNAGDSAVISDGLQDDIADAIKNMGYSVHQNIGTSAFKIDIGIVDPENTDSYRLGIICDGGCYRKAATARDRDISQASVLKGLGWNLFHVWTVDWVNHRDRVLAQIRAAFDAGQKQPEPVTAVTAATAAAAVTENAVNIEGTNIRFERAADAAADQQDTYRAVTLPKGGKPEQFYEQDTEKKIQQYIMTVIAREAPVSEKDICRKVMNAWGITRSGSKVDAVLKRQLAASGCQKTVTDEMAFYWNAGQDPASYEGFRRSAADDPEKRDMDEICAEETANAVSYVVTQNVSISRDDLLREVSKLFGFTRPGSTAEAAVRNGLIYAVKKGCVKIDTETGRIGIPE